MVPVGLWLSDSLCPPLTQTSRHTLGFVGHVQKKQGLQYVIQAIPVILRSISDFRFVVIGGGDYVPELRKLARDVRVSHAVDFIGYMKDHKEIEQLLSQCALAVALYDRLDSGRLSFSYFGNPTKIKTYLSAGLPVVMTNVPYNAKETAQAGCGRIVTADPKDIAEVITDVMSEPKTLQMYRENVISYRKQFDWNKIFGLHLSRLI